MGIEAITALLGRRLSLKSGSWSGWLSVEDLHPEPGEAGRRACAAVDVLGDAVLAHLRRQVLRVSGPVRILSLGAPVAAACLEAVQKLSTSGDAPPMELHVADDCAVRLRDLARDARRAGVEASVRLHAVSPSELVCRRTTGRWDLIDATGVLDRAPFHESMTLLRQARQLLSPRGLLITSQLTPRPWTEMTTFLRADRPFRRDPVDLGHLLAMAGCDAPQIHTLDTPAGPTAVALCPTWQ